MRWFPAAATVNAGHPEWGPGVTPEGGPNANKNERNWIDFLSRYLIKQSTNGDPTIYGQYQNSSVFWGCPAYTVENWMPTATNGQQNSLSYGMSMYAVGPYTNTVELITNADAIRLQVGLGTIANAAYISTGGAVTYAPSGGKGQFFKMEQWGRHGQDKGLVADSNGFDLIASNDWTKADDLAGDAAVATEPASMGMTYPHPAAGALPTSYVSVDGMRHLAPTSDKRKVTRGRGINMLFVDGHANSVSPRDSMDRDDGCRCGYHEMN